MFSPTRRSEPRRARAKPAPAAAPRPSRPPEPRRFGELDEAIDATVASYTGDLAIDNLESAALPNVRAVIEAYQRLVPVLYMGFYSTRPLSKANLRHEVAEHLYAAHGPLIEQIDRALSYEVTTGRRDRMEPGASEQIVLDLFRAIPRLRRTLDGDVRAAYEGDPAAESIEEIVFSYPSLRAVTAYRIAHELELAGVPMIPRILSEHAHAHTGIDISPGADIGERFFIDHGTGVVIGETTRIGDGVKLYQGVTLGALSVPHRDGRTLGKRHPTIEDDVTIYAGATILGGDTVVGRGSVIGGNVWLVRSVPPGSKVFGRGRAEHAKPG